MIADLIGRNLSRNTIRNVICVVRGMFNQAIESGLIESNSAAKLGRFTRTVKTVESKGVALTPAEVNAFLDSAKEVCPDYYPLFLTALRGPAPR